MQVLKFGGTSIGTADSMKLLIEIIKKKSQSTKTLVVVSAFSGITNKLLEVIEDAKRGNERYKIKLDDIKYIHFDRITSLEVKHVDELEKVIIQEMDQVAELCKGIYLTQSISQKTKAQIMSTGEILSSYILANAMQVTHKDSRELIKTRSKYNNATVDFKATNANIISFFESNSANITILGGFISSNKREETTTLGRGGSDFSAAIYAAALDVEKLEIWTDVSGMFTANPKIVKNAFPIEEISYQEAMELSHFGAKVIYPPTIIPVLEKSIPIHIKNTFEPDENGTIISHKIIKRTHSITGITHINDVALITLEGNGMIGIPGFSKRLFEALYFERINVKLITQASSEHSICIAIDIKNVNRVAQTVNQAFEYEILTKRVSPLIVEKNLSIIAVVGEQMRFHHGISGKLFSALGNNNINVRAIAQGASEKNISVVIDTKDTTKSLISLHQIFFSNVQQKIINLFIIGIGNVGTTLIKQIKNQQKYLKKHLNINLKVCALANSKKMIFDEDGIDLANWIPSFDLRGETTDFNNFYKKVVKMNLPHSIFVDNTANTEITTYYPKFLKEKIGIVTCNKIACSSDYTYYNKLQEFAKEFHAPFLYETNVGAGLPIIETLKNCIASGDKIIEIKAVLSGSLNYIFNNFNPNSDETSFYNVVKDAGIEGYTEPDPRIDISGIDVARKILILARESGHELELNDIENISFLPESAKKSTSISNFMESLKKESAHFNTLFIKASQGNNRLKYVASFKNGKAKVSLEEVAVNHPFYNLEGSDNIVLFYTSRYKKQPLLIKGAGAGAEVTASGLFADIIRAAKAM